MNTNTKLTLISITSLTLALSASLQPANAQQSRGAARFNFAPNYYRLEQSNVPVTSYHPQPHSVRSGHVPSSSDILGVDPGSLPVVHTQTQATLSQTPTHYKESFGAPVNAPVMAALPATALGLPKTNNKAASVNKAVAGKLINKKVAGKLLRQNHIAGNSARALALGPAASYGKNFGYEPGTTTPSAYGDGATVNTAVSGRLLHHK